MASPASIKLAFGDEIRRVRINVSTLSLDALKSLVVVTFPEVGGHYIIQYVDNEGDVITIRNDAELAESFRVFAAAGTDSSKSLKFSVIAKDMKSIIHEHTDPVFEKLEKLADTVSERVLQIVEKAKTEDWTGQVKDGIYKTADIIVSTTKDGVTKTGEILVNGARIAHVEIQDIGKKISEEDLKRMMGDVFAQIQNHLNSVASTAASVMPVSSSGIEVSEIVTDVADENEEVAGSDNLMLVKEENVQPPASSTQQEDEWIVHQQEEVSSISSDEEIAPSEWQHEINYIREVFPDQAVELVTALLNKHSGNVQLVMNDVMDM